MIKLDMLIKKSKSLKNWFTVKFKKHPYLYSVLLGWIIFIVPGLYGFYKSWGNTTGALVVSILILLNFAILLLWFQKNKSKIKPFYKRNKKIFNKDYFYLGSVFSLIPIASLIGIIATGGVNNFIERAKFEINVIVINYNNDYGYCTSSQPFMGFPTANRLFWFNEETQYIDYFDNKFTFVLKDVELSNANHCKNTRYLLKEAQKGNEDAKEILVAYPPYLRALYSFPPTGNSNNYIFSKYEKNIANMNLDNPAIAYSYAIYLDDTFLNRYWWDDKNKPLNVKPDALKYLKQSAEDGYFSAMTDLISIYAEKNYINQVNCNNYLKYITALADEKSLMPYYNLMNGYMGKLRHPQSKKVFKCLNNKPNFSKSFSMLTKRPTTGSTNYQSKKSNNLNSSYPAIYYLYGLGDVKQDYNKAYELFSYSEDNPGNSGIPDQAYLAYMNFMGMGVEQNPNKGKGLAIELAKNIPITKTQKNSWGQTLLCGDVSYNFIISDLLNSESYWMKKNYSQLSKYDKKKLSKEHDANEKIDKKVRKKYRDKLGQCLFESEPEVSIKFLKDYIYNRMNDWFKNPELVKTLNYLGEPK